MPSRHAPKNRRAQKLDVLELQIEDSFRIHCFDPNKGVLYAIRPGMLLLAAPCARSILSGEPAYIYRSDDLEIALSRDELLRLLGRELRPDEYYKLLNHFGMAFEWHDDFYDENTGRALQPVNDC